MQVGRVTTVIADGVKEIWLSSEDTGAYGGYLFFLNGSQCYFPKCSFFFSQMTP